MFLCFTYVWNSTAPTLRSEMTHVHVASRRRSAAVWPLQHLPLGVSTRQLATDFPRLRGRCAVQVAFSVATDIPKARLRHNLHPLPHFRHQRAWLTTSPSLSWSGALVDNRIFLLKLRTSLDSRRIQSLRPPASRGRRLTHVPRRVLSTRLEKQLFL